MILRIPLMCKKRSICFGTANKNPLYDGFSIHIDLKLSFSGYACFAEWTRYCYRSRIELDKVWW